MHRTENDNGVVKMTPIDALGVKGSHQIALAPGSYRIMSMGLKTPVKEGESFPLTLIFDEAGKIDVIIKIEKADGMASGDMGGINMN